MISENNDDQNDDHRGNFNVLLIYKVKLLEALLYKLKVR